MAPAAARLGRTDRKFQRHALALLEEVSVKAVAGAGLTLGDIDMLVVNTITGLAIPSLDARLMNRLDFRPDVERLPIFGWVAAEVSPAWRARRASRRAIPGRTSSS